MKILAGTEYRAKDKIVSKMTREGLTEENIREGSVKEISQRSRGHPAEREKRYAPLRTVWKTVWSRNRIRQERVPLWEKKYSGRKKREKRKQRKSFQKSFVIRNPYLKKAWRDISFQFRISKKKSG